MSALADAELYRLAQEAAQGAYVPFSRFPVGAAVRMAGGTVVTGANVDNASYPLTMCAERNAVSAAVTSGHGRVVAAAVYAGAAASPCGACRQVLAEHAADDCIVTFRWTHGPIAVPLRELLPYAFELEAGRR